MRNIRDKFSLIFGGIIRSLDKIFQTGIEAAQLIVLIIDGMWRPRTMGFPVFHVADSGLGDLVHWPIQSKIKNSDRKE